MIGDDDGMRGLLRSLSPSARGHFRNVLIHDQADRDAIASQLLRYRDRHGDDWADIIDLLTMHQRPATGGAGRWGTRGRFSIWVIDPVVNAVVMRTSPLGVLAITLGVVATNRGQRSVLRSRSISQRRRAYLVSSTVRHPEAKV